jgi:hypothetical protein
VTGRRLRTILVLAAILLPDLVGSALGLSDDDGVFDFSWQVVLAACFAGTLWAELSLTRPAGQVRVALLAPRDTASYLGRLLRWSPVVVSGVAGAVWAATTALPARTTNGMVIERASRIEILIGLALSITLPALVAVTQRWIVRRPQPYSIPSLVDADDAIRAASVRYLAAVGSAMALVNLAGGAVQFLPFRGFQGDFLFGGIASASLIGAWFYWNARKPGRLMRPTRPLRPYSPAS